jgi:hypothetical protein
MSDIFIILYVSCDIRLRIKEKLGRGPFLTKQHSHLRQTVITIPSVMSAVFLIAKSFW